MLPKYYIVALPLTTLEKVPVGGCCMQDQQCQENEYSVCKQGRCVCSAGYILINLECYEGKSKCLQRHV